MTKEKFIIPPVEEIQYLDSEVRNSYDLETDSYSDISRPKVCGPMYRASSSSEEDFSIEYTLAEEVFLKKDGDYIHKWKISGSLSDLKKEQGKLEDGKYKIFRLTSKGFERDEEEEEKVKDSLRRDIRKFELAVESGEAINRHISIGFLTMETKIDGCIYACPKQTPLTLPVYTPPKYNNGPCRIS